MDRLIPLIPALPLAGFVITAAFGRRMGRSAGWLPVGLVVASWAISHPGLSQMFFWTTAVPFAEILSVWGLVLALDAVSTRRRQMLTFAAVSGATLLVSLVYVRFTTDTKSGVLPGWIGLASAVLVIVLVGHMLRIPFRARALTAALGAIAISIPVNLIALPTQPDPRMSDPHLLAQSEAAQWVESHTPVGDLLATNSPAIAAMRLASSSNPVARKAR